MGRKLVVFIDGTGNEIEENESNILRLYKFIAADEDQILYYEPGVGTDETRSLDKRRFDMYRKALAKATGRGLEKTVLHAYRFLVMNYRDGDQLYFFGYSRGAYTARVLAGFINNFGIVRPEEQHLIVPVYRAYQRLSKRDESDILTKVKGEESRRYRALRIYDQFFHPMRHPPIRVLGLFDTVNSTWRFRPDLANWQLVEFGAHANVSSNPSVHSVFQALAIDERRRLFRHLNWTKGERFYGNRFKLKDRGKQDVRQMWFAGAHRDIGGSAPETDAGLGKLVLVWMKEQLDSLPPESRLRFHETRFARYALGQGRNAKTQQRKVAISTPNPLAKMHQKLFPFWFLIEWWPRWAWLSQDPNRKARLGIYMPLGERRYVDTEDAVHPSVKERIEHHKPDYRPKNLHHKFEKKE